MCFGGNVGGCGLGLEISSWTLGALERRSDEEEYGQLASLDAGLVARVWKAPVEESVQESDSGYRQCMEPEGFKKDTLYRANDSLITEFRRGKVHSNRSRNSVHPPLPHIHVPSYIRILAGAGSAFPPGILEVSPWSFSFSFGGGVGGPAAVVTATPMGEGGT